MTTQAQQSTVTTAIVVAAPIDRAFQVFTNEMDSWWPENHHILQGELAEMVFEPHAGGRVFDRGTDGSECQWARVLAFDPPHRFVMSWDISLQWQIETDPARTSEVEVRFIALGDRETRVELEHRGIERHGAGWEAMRDAVASPDGWQVGLDRFAAAVSGA